MQYLFLVLFCFFVLSSFHRSQSEIDSYKLSIEARGCHYQIIVNDEMALEGKSYKDISKKIQINKYLNDGEEQKVNITMLRISREIPLKSTQAFLNVKLEKESGDSLVSVKEVKLPTFPYDNDEAQPQSIGGSIYFKVKKKEEVKDSIPIPINANPELKPTEE